jgi:hypothetical protein
MHPAEGLPITGINAETSVLGFHLHKVRDIIFNQHPTTDRVFDRSHRFAPSAAFMP